jgi:hypothetical protein
MDVQSLPSRLEGASARIPGSMDELDGPVSGTVVLPLRLVWSGPPDFDVADRRERLTLYCTLLDCGRRDDIVRYIHPEHLRDDWPRIRKSTSRQLVALWERHLPELAAAA